jgi:hypothetical protein
MKLTSRMRMLLSTVGFLAVAAFFLTTEHRAHLFGLLPYLLLLACPLLHLLGHGGHGVHGAHGRPAPSSGRAARERAAHADHSTGRDRAP